MEWRHQAITWTNLDFSLETSVLVVNLKKIASCRSFWKIGYMYKFGVQKIILVAMQLFCVIGLSIIHSKLRPYLPGVKSW